MVQSTSPAAPPSLPLHFQFLAGGIAGTSEILVMYPLDVVKTRNQLSTAKIHPSIIASFVGIVKKEGFARLYRGIVPPILVETPKRAIKFSANEHYKQYVPASSYSQMITGTMAGCTEAFIVVPFDLVKIRLQAPDSVYKSTFDCIRSIAINEGPLTFLNGIESTLWRHGIWSGVYFGSIDTVKRNLIPESWKKNGNVGLGGMFVAGLIGGTLGTFFNTPFDVVKTRIQGHARSSTSTGPPSRYSWALPGLVTVAREEGLTALWRGFLPKVLRLGPGGGIMLVVFDVVSRWIRVNWM